MSSHHGHERDLRWVGLLICVASACSMVALFVWLASLR